MVMPDANGRAQIVMGVAVITCVFLQAYQFLDACS